MTPRAVLLAAAGAMLAAAAPAAAQDRQPALDRVVFDLCPRVLEGKLSLADPAQVAAIGFTPTAPRDTPGGKSPRTETGTGTGRIVFSAGSDGETCGIWFGGPDNDRLFTGLMKRARAAGYAGGNAMALGDGTKIYLLKNDRDKRSITIIAGDAGGELDFAPATTVVVMNDKGN